MSNQNTEKSPGIDFALFSRTCEMGMNNFGYLNIYSDIYSPVPNNRMGPNKKGGRVRQIT